MYEGIDVEVPESDFGASRVAVKSSEWIGKYR